MVTKNTSMLQTVVGSDTLASSRMDRVIMTVSAVPRTFILNVAVTDLCLAIPNTCGIKQLTARSNV